ncbi:unnamed protein product [Prorocentrum cordatum]|uniref:Uncharacterized protein n=1 Tax=Prorocentrum cordatum TaxID=2364126 RepID=A0ABN9TI02_9DINO|nr:unnamed protein product [Polarella glacialis]
MNVVRATDRPANRLAAPSMEHPDYISRAGQAPTMLSSGKLTLEALVSPNSVAGRAEMRSCSDWSSTSLVCCLRLDSPYDLVPSPLLFRDAATSYVQEPAARARTWSC